MNVQSMNFKDMKDKGLEQIGVGGIPTIGAPMGGTGSGGGGGDYPPSGGVPKSDLSSSVRASLDKADSAIQPMAIVSASGTTLSPAVNTYYRFDAEVGTLAITLPAITDNTHISNIVFVLTTGSSPAVTFAASGTGINVIAQDGFSIEASTTYEINAIYNGVAWVVAAMKLSSTPINS